MYFIDHTSLSFTNLGAHFLIKRNKETRLNESGRRPRPARAPHILRDSLPYGATEFAT
jgi:hypothetical protein